MADPSAVSILVENTKMMATRPDAPSGGKDKYDEIYARYSKALGGDVEANPDLLSSFSTPGPSIDTNGGGANNEQKDPPRLDPPEEYSEPSRPKSYYPPLSDQELPTMHYIPPPTADQERYYQDYSSNIPDVGVVASRDDDNATVYSSSQFSVGSGGTTSVGSGGRGGQARTDIYSRRDDIYDRLEKLNARRDALRGITTPDYSTYASSTYASLPTYNEYSPTSVMSYPQPSYAAEPSSQSSVASSMLPSKYSQKSTEEIDSRLEYLTKESLAYQNRAASPPSLTNSKKVTFESDYIYGSNIGMMDDRSIAGSVHSANNMPSAIPAAGAATSSTSVASGAEASISSSAALLIKSLTMESTSDASKSTRKSSKSLAMRVLSEKILDGYTMTRNHCPKCKMALLLGSNKKSSTAAENQSSDLFNSDGSLNMASLDKKINGIGGAAAKEECAFCPIDDLRTTISRNVCKRVMASKLLSGLEVGKSSTASGGKSLCDVCQSPSLSNSSGAAMECQVCPILDAACLEMVREEGKGGTIARNSFCGVCACPQICAVSGLMKCVVCEVLKRELGNLPQSCAASVAPSINSSSLGKSSASSIVGTSFLPSSATSVVVQPTPLNPSSVTRGMVSLMSDTTNSITEDVTSLPPDMTKSPNINVNEFPTDITNKVDYLTRLQQQIQEELAKVGTVSHLSIPILGCQPLDQGPSIEEGRGQEIVKSPSITSGSTSPPDLAKLQEELRVGLERASKSRSRASASLDLNQLQNELKLELAKAKESQAMLERNLENHPANNAGGADLTSASIKSREELKAELDKAKQEQVALLTKIIMGTKWAAAGGAAGICAPDEDPDPTVSKDDTHDLLAAADHVNQSYSISQQEVDATGHIKEYIPPPSYFHRSNIPRVVVVYHIPEDNDCDPSVAATSHHTKNLKKYPALPPERHESSFLDCCGSSKPVVVQHPKYHHLDDQHQDDYDYDTIETDADYSVDYTLNTMDDSRFDHLRESHSRSKASRDVQDRYQVEDDTDKVSGRQRPRSNSVPNSSTGKCLMSIFQCGAIDDTDAYSMVSRRGIMMQPHHPQQHLYHRDIMQYEQYQQEMPRESREPSLGGGSSHHNNFRNQNAEGYNPEQRHESNLKHQVQKQRGLSAVENAGALRHQQFRRQTSERYTPNPSMDSRNMAYEGRMQVAEKQVVDNYGGSLRRKQYIREDSNPSSMASDCDSMCRAGPGSPASPKSPGSKSFRKKYSIDESEYDGNSMCRVGETVQSPKLQHHDQWNYSSFSNKHSFDESEPGKDDRNEILRQKVRSPSPLSEFSGMSSKQQYSLGGGGSINNWSDYGPPRYPKSSLRPPRSPSDSPPLSSAPLPPPPPPSRYLDQYSVQSDLSDYSSVNRKVTFGNGSFSRRDQNQRKIIQQQQRLRALTEESGGSNIHDRHLSQVDSSLSGSRRF